MRIKAILCMDCGKLFDIASKEVEWYKKREFQIPSHCPACRKQRRDAEQRRSKRIQKYIV